MKEAEESGNTEKLISLLKEGIEAEKNGGIRSPRLSYRRKLADLYCASGLAKEEMAERMALFAEDPSRTITDYKRIRQLSPAADWPGVKEKLLGKTVGGIRLEIFEEENMAKELYEEVMKEPDLSLLNRYGYMLEKVDGKAFLSAYACLLDTLAKDSRGRKAYEVLIRELTRLTKFNGGRDLAGKLAEKWMNQRPGRRLLNVQLEEFL